MTVGDLMKKVMPRLSGPTQIPFLEAIQLTIDAVTDRLVQIKSGYVRGDLDEDFLAGEPDITMPDAFRGFYTQPWLEGSTVTLAPLLPGTKPLLTQDGVPTYYELRGLTLTLYPPPLEAGTLLGEIFIAPDAVDALSDDIPFDGAFDRALVELVLFVLHVGSAAVVDPAFDAMVHSLIDDPVHRHTKKNIVWSYPK